jgi:hypothetical protein
MSNNPQMRLPQEVPDEAYEETLNPETDPSVNALAQQVIADANAAPEQPQAGEPPTVPHPSDAIHVELPVGLFNPLDGEVINTAEVRELNGEDEEYFLRGKDFWDRKSRIVERGTVSLGSDKPEKSVLMTLAQGDREALLLAIRRATYGDDLEMSLRCPQCRETHEISVDLRVEIPIREQDGLNHELALKSGTKVAFHWPTGEDQKKVAEFVNKKRNANAGEINTQMLAQVLETIDSSPSFGETTARQMGLKDRNELVEYIAENNPGPIYDDIRFECPGCGLEDKVEVTFEDLFR